jgi:hypothetical protein
VGGVYILKNGIEDRYEDLLAAVHRMSDKQVHDISKLMEVLDGLEKASRRVEPHDEGREG